MDTSKIVGEKIKALREDKSISIEELAQRSGLAIEQIERIENNIDIPSLAPLIKIARVLGVRLGTFLDDQDEIGPVVCRKKEAKDAISFSNNAIHSRKHMEYHSLSKSKADRQMHDPYAAYTKYSPQWKDAPVPYGLPGSPYYTGAFCSDRHSR